MVTNKNTLLKLGNRAGVIVWWIETFARKPDHLVCFPTIHVG